MRSRKPERAADREGAALPPKPGRVVEWDPSPEELFALVMALARAGMCLEQSTPAQSGAGTPEHDSGTTKDPGSLPGSCG